MSYEEKIEKQEAKILSDAEKYMWTEGDTLTLWKISPKVEMIKAFVVQVPTQREFECELEFAENWPGLHDSYTYDDYIDQDTGETIDIEGVDLDAINVIEDSVHDVEDMKEILANMEDES